MLAMQVHSLPLHLGVIADRRLFLVFSFFPIFYFLSQSQDSALRIFRFCVIVSVLGALLGLYLHAQGSSGGLELKSRGLREERVGVASSFIALSILITACDSLFQKKPLLFPRYVNICLLCILSYALVAVVQTRQLIIGVFLTLAVFVLAEWRSRIRWYHIFQIAVLIALVSYFLNFEFLLEILTSDYLSTNARSESIRIVLDEGVANYYILLGALADGYKGGFAALYFEYCFLADIGIFGIYYRLGIMGLVATASVILFMIFQIRKLPDGLVKTVVFAYLLFTVSILPVSSFLNDRGFIFGLMLAVLAVERRWSRGTPKAIV